MDSSSSGGDSSPPQKKTKSDGKESGKKVGRPKGRSNLPAGTYSVSKTCQKMTSFFGLPRKGLEGEEKMDEDEDDGPPAVSYTHLTLPTIPLV